MDSWLLLQKNECNGERNRGLLLLDPRGIAHSNRVESHCSLTDHGLRLLDVYVGFSKDLLAGSARVAQEAMEAAEAAERKRQLERKSLELKQKQAETRRQY